MISKSEAIEMIEIISNLNYLKSGILRGKILQIWKQENFIELSLYEKVKKEIDNVKNYIKKDKCNKCICPFDRLIKLLEQYMEDKNDN
jgi:hypothetical protein